MSRAEAVEQYQKALKEGQKYYKYAVSRGGYPYPVVLDDILDERTVSGRVNIGLVDIPSELVIGTKTAGRVSALAGNFMPILDMQSEFGAKWTDLCEAHLEEGIRDPIKCFEYMGRFYVQEGNKRASVLKSYGSPTIPGTVTRIIPEYSDAHEVQVYYEFMHFYQLSKTYIITFRHRKQYAKLQAALGFDPDHVWTENERLSFTAGFMHFRAAFEKQNINKADVTAAEALLVWLQVFPFSDTKEMTTAELLKSIASLWPDIKTQTREANIEVSTTPANEGSKGIISNISKLLSFRPEHANAAFIYAFDPRVSEWTRAHDHGREYIEQRLGDKVSVTVYPAYSGEYYEAMVQAVNDGAQIIFATTPHMIDACRRIAAEYKDVRVFNCSISMPYTNVRVYYARIYEAKFITGAIAGAMAGSDGIGCISGYPIFGVPASINAFALGVRLTNPNARVKLGWTCIPGDPISDLIKSGVTVISNRDATNPINQHWALEWGTYKLAADGSMQPLAVPCWHWGPFYEKILVALLSGSLGEAPAERAINYWWGMDTGVIDVQLSPSLPDGVYTLANILKDGLSRGEISPFKTHMIDQNGIVRCNGEQELNFEEILKMDWLCDNVDGSIPGFDELLPRAHGLVRLLGVYRDQIPPEKEVKQL